MAKMTRWIVAGFLLTAQAACAEPLTVTLPSGDTVAVVKPTLTTSEMDFKLQKAIDGLSIGKLQEPKALVPETVTSPPVLTGYSLYPR